VLLRQRQAAMTVHPLRKMFLILAWPYSGAGCTVISWRTDRFHLRAVGKTGAHQGKRSKALWEAVASGLDVKLHGIWVMPSLKPGNDRILRAGPILG
jgi:hypothetical protein